MNYWWIVVAVLLIYFIMGFYVMFFMINNGSFWRKRKYKIPFGLQAGKQVRKELQHPKRVYHLCYHPNNKNKWVVLLHSFGHHSGWMVSRAKIYWEQGFSLVFIDARCFGQSQRTLYTSSHHYALDAKQILETEQIREPIVHGVSFGALAAVELATMYKVKALVVEALSSKLTTIYQDFMNSMGKLNYLYFWVPWLLYKKSFDWEGKAPVKLLQTIEVPILHIHGEKDKLFKPEKHFEPVKKILERKKDSTSWLVPGSKHSLMNEHPQYEQKIREFLQKTSQD